MEEEVVPTHKHRGRSCNLDQKDSEPSAIKEEQEETCCHQDGEQLMVKQESSTLTVTSINEKYDQSENPILYLNPDQSDEKSEVNTTVEVSVSPTSDCDLQLLSNSPHVVQSKDQKNYNCKELESKCKHHPGNSNNTSDSAMDCNTDTGKTPLTFNTCSSGNRCFFSCAPIAFSYYYYTKSFSLIFPPNLLAGYSTFPQEKEETLLSQLREMCVLPQQAGHQKSQGQCKYTEPCRENNIYIFCIHSMH